MTICYCGRPQSDFAMFTFLGSSLLTDARKKRIIRGTKLLTVDRNNRPHLLTSPRSMRVAGFFCFGKGLGNGG